MIQLLSQFTLVEILTVIVGVALSAKAVITFFEWAWEKIKGIFSNELAEEQKVEQIQCTQALHQKVLDDLQDQQKIILSKLDMLIDSDKDQLKAEITRQHHYFMGLGKIDDYSLACLEKEFNHYREEGGNSFIEGFMEDLRDLPIASVDGSILSK